MPKKKQKDEPTKNLAAIVAERMKNVTIQPASVGAELNIPGVISTRCPVLDAAIGRGGVPMGRLTVITGGESNGKTTLALHLCAEAQARGGMAIYVDKEQKLHLGYAENLGVKLDDMLLKQSGSMEDCFALMEEAIGLALEIKPDGPIVCVLDSINAARTDREYEGGYDDIHVAPQASVLSKGIPKLIDCIGGKKVALVFISQVRENIGAYSARNTVCGGNAPRFYSALVIELNRGGWYKESETKKGIIVKARITKNGIGPPMKEAVFNIVWPFGIDYRQALVDRGVQLGEIAKSGGWYEMLVDGKSVKWQGRRKLDKLIEKRPEVLQWLEKSIS